MSRLIDKILMAEFPVAMLGDEDRLIEDAEIIVADNVARYFYENEKYEKGDYFNLVSFPNIAPPFDNFFIEYRLPKRLHIHAKEIGIHFMSLEVTDETRENAFIDNFFKIAPEAIGAGWIHLCAFYMSGKDCDIIRIPHCLAFASAPDGRPIVHSGGDFWIFSKIEPQEGEKDLLHSYVINGAYPAFLAISFMHCKNVVLRSETPPIKLSRKHEKKNGRPLWGYKLLEIEPMKKVLASEGNIEKSGIQHALHICRGHFKDYRERGLFGKYKGMFWWDSHVRGDSAHGVVVKDYKVNQPSMQAAP